MRIPSIRIFPPPWWIVNENCWTASSQWPQCHADCQQEVQQSCQWPLPLEKVPCPLHRDCWALWLPYSKVLEFSKFRKLECLDLSTILPFPVYSNDDNSFKVTSELKIMKIMEVAGTLPLKSLDLSHNYLAYTLDQDFLVNIVLNIEHVEFIATFNTCQRTSLQILNKILDGVSLT